MAIRNPQEVGALLWYDMTDASTITVDGSNFVQSIVNKLGTNTGQNFTNAGGSTLRPYAKRPQDVFGPNNAGVISQYRNTGTDNLGSAIVQAARLTDTGPITIFMVLQGDYGTTYATYNRGMLGRAGAPTTLITIESGSFLRLTINGTNTDTNISPLSRIHNVPMCLFLTLEPTAVANLKISTDFSTYLFNINSSNLATGGCPCIGLPTSFSAGSMVGWYGCCAVFKKVLTTQEMTDLMDWAKSVFVASTPPYSDVHTVANVTYASDPDCIYYGQTPTIAIGDKFSFKNTTETNLWPVSIDANGFPIVNSYGAFGTDSFLFNISRGGGAWTPAAPAHDAWTFTIAAPGPPVLLTVNGGNPVYAGQTSVSFTGSNLGSSPTARTLLLTQGSIEVVQDQVSGDANGGLFNVVGYGPGGKLKYGQAEFKVTVP